MDDITARALEELRKDPGGDVADALGRAFPGWSRTDCSNLAEVLRFRGQWPEPGNETSITDPAVR